MKPASSSIDETPDETPGAARAPRAGAILSDALIVWGISCALLLALLAAVHLLLEHRYGPGHIFDHYARLTPEQRAAYAGWSPADLNDMLTATWSPGFTYQPWLGWREKPRATRFVNVSADGIRATAGGARSLADYGPGALFLFGGSTLFGYGLPDDQTIASDVQAMVGGRARVFNFGDGLYYSAQENFLLESLLRAGYRPAVVAFLDGLNERCDLDAYQKELAAIFSRAQGDYSWRWTDAFEPFFFVAAKLRHRAHPGWNFDLHRTECVRFGRHAALAEVVRQNLADRSRICAQYGVRCVSFTQPIAGVNARQPDFALLPQADRDKLRRKAEHLAPVFRDAGMVDLGSALDGLGAPAFVDNLHYSAAAARAIAQRMSAVLSPLVTAPGAARR